MARIRRPLYPYLPGVVLLGFAAWNAFSAQKRSAADLSWVILALIGAGLLFFGDLIGKLISTFHNLYAGPNTYRAATEMDLAELDRSFYDTQRPHL
jgi:hypothetical protein